MRAVVQRVSRASVTVGEEVTGGIERGLLVLLAVSKHDGDDDADYIVQKILNMRIFEDADGKMNLNVVDVAGGILLVSQFTLYGDMRKGRRPSFDLAAAPAEAEHWYKDVVRRLEAANVRCATGRFRAMMQVELVNDGPVTILLDSGRAF
jgi:D-tyrosyl-tRNA(Tyr) deacylase